MAPRPSVTEFHGIVTASAEMLALFEQIKRAASTQAAVLVRGETGSGKELVARAIHDLSPRSGGRFRAVNCATFTPDLLASELFGHVRGAFTGAVADRPGLFKQADGGTVFLDEIAETPLMLQAQLLRVLEDRSIVPVGGTRAEQIDIRVVSATNKAMRREVAALRFRADLMYRVRVIPLFLPPLRARGDDIELLARHFLQRFCEGQPEKKLDHAAAKAMHQYPWPGNVRELRNVIEYAVAMSPGSTITLADLTPELRGEEPDDFGSPSLGEKDARERILEALRHTGGNKGEAAKRLGVNRTTLWRQMRELQIKTP